MAYNREIYITDNDYRITRSYSGYTNGYMFIEHNCDLKRVDALWSAVIFSVEGRGFACPWCNSPVPEGIQAMFWFLKEDFHNGR